MIINFLLVIIGFVLLVEGANWLVDGSSGIAKKFHIPEIIIGLTLVSIGTSMPELFVSVSSSLEGLQDMSMGNVIGSNLCNLLLILGLSATIKEIEFKKETKLIEIPMCLGFTILFMVLCNIGKEISFIDSIILLLGFIIFIGYTIYMGLKGTNEETETIKNRSIIMNIILLVLGIFALKYGSDFVVDNCEIIAKNFGVSEKIISLTIIAIGTSLPELVTSVTAAVKGNSDIAIGNILGSNIFNLLLIIGVAGIIKPVSYSVSYNIQMTILIISTLIMGLFPYIGKKDTMTKKNGIIYLGLYLLYMILLFKA